jgi:type I restriction enzyme, R subunit
LQGSKRNIAGIDVNENIEDSEFSVEGTIFDIRTYRQKVIDYLAENYNNPIINKIKNLEPITNDDLDELHRILCVELGTYEDYQKEVNIPNFAVFIRSLIGLSQDAVNAKFGKYLSGNRFNSMQQEYIRTIINYVRENGDITKEDLVETEPFKNFNILELFEEAVPEIVEIVNVLHNSITVAA